MSMQTLNIQNRYEQTKELLKGQAEKQEKGREKSETSNERGETVECQETNIQKYRSPPRKQDISDLSLEILEGLNKAKIKVQEQRILFSLEDMLKKQTQVQIEQCRQIQDLLKLEIINLEEMEKKQNVFNLEHQILSIKQEIIKCENKIQQILDGDHQETKKCYPQSQYHYSQIRQNEISAVSLQNNQHNRYHTSQNHDYYQKDCSKPSNIKKHVVPTREVQDNERNYFRQNYFKSVDERGQKLYKCKNKKAINQKYVNHNSHLEVQEKQAKSHIYEPVPDARSKNKFKLSNQVQNVSTNTHSRTGSTLSLKGVHNGQRFIIQKKKCLMKRKACAQEQLQSTLNYFEKRVKIMKVEIDTLKKQIHIIDDIFYKRNQDWVQAKRRYVTPTRNKNEERSIQQKIKQYRTKTLSHRRQSSNLFAAARSKQKKLIYQISRKKQMSTISHCLSQRRITSQITNTKNLERGENKKQGKVGIQRSRIIEQSQWCEYYEKKQKSPVKKGAYKPKPTYYK